MKNTFLLMVLAMPVAVFSQKTETAVDRTDKLVALSNYYLENYAVAAKGLSKAFAEDSTDAEIAYSLAKSYVNMEQYAAGLRFYKKAVQLNPAAGTWSYELALLCYDQDDFKNAAHFFEKAAAKGYKTDTDFAENIGYACLYSNQLEKGEGLLMTVFAKKPGNKEILRDIAQAYYDKRRYDKSLTYYQKLVKLDRLDAAALYQAGICLQKEGKKELGQQLCKKAIKIKPGLLATISRSNAGNW